MKTKKQTKQTNKQNVNEQTNDNVIVFDDIDIDEILRGLDDNDNKTKTKRTKRTKQTVNEQNDIEQNVNELIKNNNKQNKIIEKLQKQTNELIQILNERDNTINELINRIDNIENKNSCCNEVDVWAMDEDIDNIKQTVYGSAELMYNDIDDINKNLNEQIYGDLKKQNEQHYQNSIIGKLKTAQKKLNEQNNTINTLITANNRIYDYTEQLEKRIAELENKQTIKQNVQLYEQTNKTITKTADINYSNSKILLTYLFSMISIFIFTNVKYIIIAPVIYFTNTINNIRIDIKTKIDNYKRKRRYQKQNRISKRIQKLYAELNELS